jgi:hypothetical protein
MRLNVRSHLFGLKERILKPLRFLLWVPLFMLCGCYVVEDTRPEYIRRIERRAFIECLMRRETQKWQACRKRWK